MRIVVSDSSCLIDLRRVSLLDALLRLPCEFLIPNTLFEDELLKFTPVQKKALVRGGLQVIDLPGERVLRAQAVMRQAPRLSVHDGFAELTHRRIPRLFRRHTSVDIVLRLASRYGIDRSRSLTDPSSLVMSQLQT